MGVWLCSYLWWDDESNYSGIQYKYTDANEVAYYFDANGTLTAIENEYGDKVLVTNKGYEFEDVSYIEIPTKINEIEILQTKQADIDYIAQRIGNTNKTITVLSSGNRKYYVVSSVVKVLENVLDMFELPFEIPNYNGK